MRWVQNQNRFNVQTPYGNRFLSLTGNGNPPREPYPFLTRPGTPVQQGRYQLKFALGQDRNNGFPGPVSADVGVSGVATLHQAFSTDANGANWQVFSLEFNVPSNGTVDIAFGATAGQGQLPVRYVGLDNISLRQFVPVVHCTQ